MKKDTNQALHILGRKLPTFSSQGNSREESTKQASTAFQCRFILELLEQSFRDISHCLSKFLRLCFSLFCIYSWNRRGKEPKPLFTSRLKKPTIWKRDSITQIAKLKRPPRSAATWIMQKGYGIFLKNSWEYSSKFEWFVNIPQKINHFNFNPLMRDSCLG